LLDEKPDNKGESSKTETAERRARSIQGSRFLAASRAG
jgi:hypothetical protein